MQVRNLPKPFKRMQKIIVVDYDPIWKRWFEELKEIILQQLSGLDITIEHVGSTSVEGLPAKPIIDLDIIAENNNDIQAIIIGLEKSGYIHQGDLGILGREAFRKCRANVPFSHESSRVIDHHLYLCHKGNVALENHLSLRNYLRKNPQAVSEYGNLKKQLAKEFPYDIDAYVEGKSEFITGILEKCGFNPEDLSSITDQNKKKESPFAKAMEDLRKGKRQGAMSEAKEKRIKKKEKRKKTRLSKWLINLANGWGYKNN